MHRRSSVCLELLEKEEVCCERLLKGARVSIDPSDALVGFFFQNGPHVLRELFLLGLGQARHIRLGQDAVDQPLRGDGLTAVDGLQVVADVGVVGRAEVLLVRLFARERER